MFETGSSATFGVMRLLWAAALAVCFLAQPATPQKQFTDTPDSGFAAGALAPDFELPDQSGRPRNWKSLAGPRGLVLVFFRSADW